jgi:hypothetical protein
VNTLLLDTSLWDLCKTAAGDIAVASDPYATAQSVANACRVFLGEQWYNTTLGVPYLTRIFDRSPPPFSFLKAQLVATAKTVPGVSAAVCYITKFEDRVIKSGQIQVTLTSGAMMAINMGPPGLPWYVSAVSPR